MVAAATQTLRDRQEIFSTIASLPQFRVVRSHIRDIAFGLSLLPNTDSKARRPRLLMVALTLARELSRRLAIPLRRLHYRSADAAVLWIAANYPRILNCSVPDLVFFMLSLEHSDAPAPPADRRIETALLAPSGREAAERQSVVLPSEAWSGSMPAPSSACARSPSGEAPLWSVDERCSDWEEEIDRLNGVGMHPLWILDPLIET
jgi:hypothetical protein